MKLAFTFVSRESRPLSGVMKLVCPLILIAAFLFCFGCGRYYSIVHYYYPHEKWMEVKVRLVDKPRREVFQHIVSVLVEKGIEVDSIDKSEKIITGKWYRDPLLMEMLGIKGYMEYETPLLIRPQIVLIDHGTGKTEIFINIQGKIAIKNIISVEHSIYSDQPDINYDLVESKIQIEEHTYTIPPQYYDMFFDALGKAMLVEFPHITAELPHAPLEGKSVKSMNTLRKERRGEGR